MVQRVLATEAALALIARLQARHGASLLFFQSAGCCEGSAPVCHLPGELTPGPGDWLLGVVGGCPFYVSATQYAPWQHAQLILDVQPGSGGTFSLEDPLGLHFVTRPRPYTEAERTALAALSPGGAATG